eukprot:363984-Chlamydomonas_euryale.AAC.26
MASTYAMSCSFPVYAEDFSKPDARPSFQALSDAAREACVVVVGGSIAERVDDKLYNTCCVFSKTGELLAKHRKVHLFDIDIPGKITFKESLTLTPGEVPTVVDTDVGRLGIGICYDLRFPELAQLYAKRGAQLLVYPGEHTVVHALGQTQEAVGFCNHWHAAWGAVCIGAFNMTTGPVHWELLQKARAVDNQLFVASCSPARNPAASYQAWGHSTVIGPFAEVLATTEHAADTVYAELDFAQVRAPGMPDSHSPMPRPRREMRAGASAPCLMMCLVCCRQSVKSAPKRDSRPRPFAVGAAPREHAVGQAAAL